MENRGRPDRAAGQWGILSPDCISNQTEAGGMPTAVSKPSCCRQAEIQHTRKIPAALKRERGRPHRGQVQPRAVGDLVLPVRRTFFGKVWARKSMKARTYGWVNRPRRIRRHRLLWVRGGQDRGSHLSTSLFPSRQRKKAGQIGAMPRPEIWRHSAADCHH